MHAPRIQHTPRRNRGGFWPGLILLALLSVFPGYAEAPPATPGGVSSLGDFAEFLSTRIPELMEKYGVPGVAVALVSNNGPAWERAFGFADAEERTPMTTDAIFRVESISKSVTAWGVMTLIEEGLLDLDDPITAHLPDWSFPQSEFPVDEVTVGRVLSNTSGMGIGAFGNEYAPDGRIPSLVESVREEARLVAEAGTTFIYSNAGYHLLELLIEEVTGDDFATVMSEAVLEPLGMVDASFRWSRDFDNRIPMGYETDGTPVPVYVYPAAASGGLFAGVTDIARFVAAGMNPTAVQGVPSEVPSRLYAPQIEIGGMYGVVSDWYGYGHFLEERADGTVAVWHGGQGHGWMSHFHSIPEAGEGIVILTNSQRSWPFIGEVVRDWSRWTGAGTVQMARLAYVTPIIRIVIGLIAASALLLLMVVVRGLVTGRRRFAFGAGGVKGKAACLIRAISGVVLIAIVIWRASMPYVFETSIFPADITTLAAVVVALGVVLLFSGIVGKVAHGHGKAPHRPD